MAWLITSAAGGKNTVDLTFEPDIEGSVESGSAFVRDGDPPSDRSLRFEAKLNTTRKSVPDMWFIAERWCVRDSVRHLIEDVESERHVFHPLKLLGKDRAELKGGPFFTAYFQGRVDCIDPDKSEVEVVTTQTGRTRYRAKTRRPDLAISKDTVGGRHIWYCEKIVRGLMFSDDLYEKLTSNKATGIEGSFVREV